MSRAHASVIEFPVAGGGVPLSDSPPGRSREGAPPRQEGDATGRRPWERRPLSSLACGGLSSAWVPGDTRVEGKPSQGVLPKFWRLWATHPMLCGTQSLKQKTKIPSVFEVNLHTTLCRATLSAVLGRDGTALQGRRCRVTSWNCEEGPTGRPSGGSRPSVVVRRWAPRGPRWRRAMPRWRPAGGPGRGPARPLW